MIGTPPKRSAQTQEIAMPAHLLLPLSSPPAPLPDKDEALRAREKPPNTYQPPSAPGLFETLRREMRLRNYSHQTLLKEDAP
ncbi:MAG TPA: hypothetical protein VNI77_01865 [Nitrososphaera sp.]|nr:hypothetical protein [Nitrososphaera sp.]